MEGKQKTNETPVPLPVPVQVPERSIIVKIISGAPLVRDAKKDWITHSSSPLLGDPPRTSSGTKVRRRVVVACGIPDAVVGPFPAAAKHEKTTPGKHYTGWDIASFHGGWVEKGRRQGAGLFSSQKQYPGLSTDRLFCSPTLPSVFLPIKKISKKANNVN